MIKDFQPGDSQTQFFVLNRANVIPFEGGERLSLELSDASGSIEGVVWENVNETYEQIRESDVVKAQGLISTYRGKLQIKVQRIRPAEATEFDLLDLLPVVACGFDALIEKFDAVTGTITDLFLTELLRKVRSSPELFDAYIKSPAGKKFHHDYLGGLAEHSLSMAELAAKVCEHYAFLNRDLILTGAILHDIGKTRELGRGAKLDYTDEGRLVGHVTLGDEIIRELISQIPDFPDKIEMKLRHLVLSHHGELEYGASTLPQTREAMVLHLVDRIDSGMNVFADSESKRSGEGGEFVRLWNRYLYFG